MEGKVTESKVGLSEQNITVVHYHCWNSKRVQLVWEWGPEWEDFNQRTRRRWNGCQVPPTLTEVSALLFCYAQGGRFLGHTWSLVIARKNSAHFPASWCPCDRRKVRYRCSLSSSTVTGLAWLFSGDPVEGACRKWVAKCVSPAALFLCWAKRGRRANQGVGGSAAAVKFPENARKGNVGPQGRQLMVFKLQADPLNSCVLTQVEILGMGEQRWSLHVGNYPHFPYQLKRNTFPSI